MTDEAAWNRQSRRLFALLRLANIKERRDRINLYRWFLQDSDICSTNEMSYDQLRSLADTLVYWQSIGELEARAREYGANPPSSR